MSSEKYDRSKKWCEKNKECNMRSRVRPDTWLQQTRIPLLITLQNLWYWYTICSTHALIILDWSHASPNLTITANWIRWIFKETIWGPPQNNPNWGELGPPGRDTAIFVIRSQETWPSRNYNSIVSSCRSSCSTWYLDLGFQFPNSSSGHVTFTSLHDRCRLSSPS